MSDENRDLNVFRNEDTVLRRAWIDRALAGVRERLQAEALAEAGVAEPAVGPVAGQAHPGPNPAANAAAAADAASAPVSASASAAASATGSAAEAPGRSRAAPRLYVVPGRRPR